MKRTLQITFLVIACTLLAVNVALKQKQTFLESRLTSLEYKLKILQESGDISSDDFYSSKELLSPLHYPILHDPWLLRYSSFIISGLLIAHSVLFFVRSPKRKDPTREDEATAGPVP